MYGTNIIGSGLTFGKVLSGISKGLSIANQVIPLYQQAKPMIENARKVMEVVREFKAAPETASKTTIEAQAKPVSEYTKKTFQPTSESPKSLPVFFQ